MSYVFVIHHADRKQFVIAADTRETIHGEVQHLAHTDFGEKLFFSSKHKFALACFDGTTVRNRTSQDDDTRRLFVSYILKEYFKHLDTADKGIDFYDCVKIFWEFINTEYSDYVNDIKKEVSLVFAGFDKDEKSQCARYGAYFDKIEKAKDEDKGKTMNVAGYIVYGPMVGFIEEVIDNLYLDKFAPNRSVAETYSRKTRLGLFINYAFEKKQAITVAKHVARKAFDEKTLINLDDTVGDVFDFVEMGSSDINNMVNTDCPRHGCRTVAEFIKKAEESIEGQRRGGVRP